MRVWDLRSGEMMLAIDMVTELRRLYHEQRQVRDDNHLRAHSSTYAAIARQVRAAELYFPYVTGRVLDWGCLHAIDACMVRMRFGAELEIHGCDIIEPTDYEVFHAYAGLKYAKLNHPYHMAYSDNHFDTVIADGVLEHVPNDGESLKEIYRILKPDGALIISCLPNRLSYLEFLGRILRKNHHMRIYGMSEIRRMLLHSGFQPVYRRFLQMTPSMSGFALAGDVPGWLNRLAGFLWNFNGVLEWVWPFNRFSSNLFVIARKRLVIY